MDKNLKIKKAIWKDDRFYFILILALLSIALIVQLFIYPVLPIKFVIPIILILVFVFGLMFMLIYSKKVNKFNRVLGKVIIAILCIALGFGNFYIFKGGQTLNDISGVKVKTDAISVIVLKDNPATKIEDLKDSKFGMMDKIDREKTDLAIKDINLKVSKTIETHSYEIATGMAQDLYDGKINAIILNEAYRSLLDDDEKYADFANKTKVIYQYEIKTELNDISKNVDVTKQPFNVYISGIDTYGSVSTTSRSDVNMIASVNPTTHQILLVSIPRDYYVPQTCQSNQSDKLTHTGIFGVECTVSSVENYFGIDLNYYVRVNFSSLISIVDALGGVTVKNPVAFNSWDYFFEAGDIQLDGEHALSYSRDRYHQAEGDRDRGKNQMRVITGIINKAISPSIITSYNGVMNAISGSFQTNMDSSEITKFIQKQLDSMSGWKISQFSVNGNGENGVWSPANGFNSYMMIPDVNTVNEAKSLIQKVHKGETLSISE